MKLKKVLILGFAIFLLPMIITAQQNLYLVYLNTNPEREKLPEEEVLVLQNGHLENIGRLYDEGDLLLAGPFDGGGGIFILTAASQEDAQALLATDPAINANRFLIETYPMQILTGMICKQDEPYEMINMNFLLFTHQLDYADNKTTKAFRKYAREEALFSFSYAVGENVLSYVAIVSQEKDPDMFARKSPLIKMGGFQYDVKSWWTTSKTFCTDKKQKIN